MYASVNNLERTRGFGKGLANTERLRSGNPPNVDEALCLV